MIGKVINTILVCLVFLIQSAACNINSSKYHKVGETVSKDGISFTLISVRKTDRITGKNDFAPLSANASDGNIFIVVLIKIENSNRINSYNYIGSFIVLVDKDNNIILEDMPSTILLDSPFYSVNEIKPLDMAEGEIVFEVPENENYQLKFTWNLGSDDILFDIEQEI